MIFLGIYGDQFPLYFPECVAQFPLSGKDHIVVSSNLNLSGDSLIRNSPFFFCSLYFCSAYLSIKILKQILNLQILNLSSVIMNVCPNILPSTFIVFIIFSILFYIFTYQNPAEQKSCG